ncbi:MAG: ECF-type sigma factor [Acidobacteriota bacterium]
MSTPDSDNITELLIAWNDGKEDALEQLMPMVYDYLRGMAANHLRGERADHTLQTDALVNEAFLRLVRQDRSRLQDRAHFFAIAARMMRRILVDHARGRQYAKRSGEKVSLEPGLIDALVSERPAELVALDDALGDLEQENPELAEIVVLHYFGGLTSEDIGVVMSMGSATVKRRLRLARAWLKSTLSPDEDGEGPGEEGVAGDGGTA